MTSGATLLFTHRACLLHDPSPGHPESPARLAAILAALDALEFAPLIRREAPRAERALIERLHPADFIERLLASVPQSDYAAIDGDTILSPDSGEAALRAAGALCAAVDAVMAGEGANAFCAVRPPGHHAEPERAMGFCLFNNVAIGALHARHAHGCARVAVIDFDVHHGNGTQAAFERDPMLFFASTHQSPLYPGTGMATEHGVGNIVNVPLPPRSGSTQFRRAMSDSILPALADFRPDFILISAGFDAHREDPLANLELTEADFAWATDEILAVAKSSCQGRVVSTLEGGYDLDALAASASAHVRALMAAAAA
jgi:acetoin utilization deacetylase AcuC-like enzyme